MQIVLENRGARRRNLQICSRCIYDETVPSISFDAEGVCSYCRLHDQMEQEYPTGARGAEILHRLAAEIKTAGKGKKYDCVVGVSGGCDSSYLLWKAVELGLRPLAVNFDNTWNSPISTQNLYNLLDSLKVDIHTLVVDNKEYDDLYLSFLKSGVRDLDSQTDIGLAATLYRAAEEHGLKYIIEGHSFRTEGISPLGWLYMDGRYIQDIQDNFGSRPLKTFPNMPMADFLRWTMFRRIKKLRLLYYMDYRKEDAKRELAARFGWEWYGGHHLENRFTAFTHLYYWPVRYGLDTRILGYAALVRSGQMARSEGLRLLDTPIEFDDGVVELVKKRLRLDEGEFERLMTLPHKTYTDFKTYKNTFHRLRPLFWLLYKADIVPKSFYLKFAAAS